LQRSYFIQSRLKESIERKSAEMGHHYIGIVEVSGSIPLGSTNSSKGSSLMRRALDAFRAPRCWTSGHRPSKNRGHVA